MDLLAFREPVRLWLESTAVSEFMRQSNWAWQTCESIHFLGLCLLIGTVGLFDLRLLGLAKQIPPPALHRMIPVGVLGFAINVATGSMFLAATPDQYLYNDAFWVKVTFLSLAGINILFFYTAVFREVKTLSAGDDAPLKAKLVGGASLTLWIGVISAGRLLTFFRP